MNPSFIRVLFLSTILFFSCGKAILPDGITFEPGNPIMGENIRLTVSGDFGDFVKYQWDFNGDSIWDTVLVVDNFVDHVYQSAGTFKTRVYVENFDGEFWNYSTMIKIGLSPKPIATAKYYLIALVDSSTWLNYQSDDPFFSENPTAQSTQWALPNYNTGFVSMYVGATISSTEIQALKNQNIPVNLADPSLKIGYLIDEEYWNSYNYYQPSALAHIAPVVTAEGSYNGRQLFRVKGTFDCMISCTTVPGAKKLTQGEFSIMVVAKSK